jgi:hypothetical protein
VASEAFDALHRPTTTMNCPILGTDVSNSTDIPSTRLLLSNEYENDDEEGSPVSGGQEFNQIASLRSLSSTFFDNPPAVPVREWIQIGRVASLWGSQSRTILKYPDYEEVLRTPSSPIHLGHTRPGMYAYAGHCSYCRLPSGSSCPSPLDPSSAHSQ